MGRWKDGRYYYSLIELEGIAIDYRNLINDSLQGMNFDTTSGGISWDDMLGAKIDFDRALNHIGRGNWSGTNFGEYPSDYDFDTYKSFSPTQKVVIAKILNVDDSELEVRGMYDLPDLRKWAFRDMRDWLNKK